MWQNEHLADSDSSSLYNDQGKDSPCYENLSETWGSDRYTNYTPSFESTKAKKCYDRRFQRRHRNDTKTTSKNKYHYEQDFSRSSSQFKHWMDEEDLKTKDLRSECRSKKERSGEKKKIPEQINPYVVNAPSCYGYFNYDEVVQQLQGIKKIYKHSTEKKLY